MDSIIEISPVFLSSQRNAWDDVFFESKRVLGTENFWESSKTHPPETLKDEKLGEPEVEHSYDGQKNHPKNWVVHPPFTPRIWSLLKCQTKWGII